MGTLVIVLMIGVIGYLLYIMQQISFVNSRQHWMFEEIKFSTKDFYLYTEAFIAEKQIPSVKISRVYHNVKGILSAQREYLRVQYHEYFFDICAAPFAHDFFVSWHQGELRQIFDRRRKKTFFEEDTELMFKESIKICIERAIDVMKRKTGYRITPSEVSLLQ